MTNENFQKRIEMSKYYREKSKKALYCMLICGGISLIPLYFSDSVKLELVGFAGGLVSLVLGGGTSMFYANKGMNYLLNQEGIKNDKRNTNYRI